MTAEHTRRAIKYSIGGAAKEAGVTPRTIRFYIAEGLLQTPGGPGQRRAYGHEHVSRLRLIKRLQTEYLPLKEIKRLTGNLSPEEMETLLVSRESPRLVLEGRAAWPSEGEGPLSPRVAEHRIAYRVRMNDSASAKPAPALGLWKRVVLAPGIELHHQVSNDPKRDAAVARIIENAARELSGE